ncbi:nicotinate-nucleotide--dimethylbenzimidazole phosphoribosyltransferase [Streptomyces inusitatus]|nr:nicotinate-nucleotide--dimethylbenzimidazole phosphoribosyltransferase [Streptomyces inusitatus]
MTDTGQIPGDGLPGNAGVAEQQPGMPGTGAYTFLDPSAHGPDEDDLLLMPGAQGAWSDTQGALAMPPLPPEVQQPPQPQPPQQPVGAPAAEPFVPGAVPAGPGFHAPADLGAPEPAVPVSGIQALAEAAAAERPVGQPAQTMAPPAAGEAPAAPGVPEAPQAPGAPAGEQPAPAPAFPPAPPAARRPLHMGPPLPDTSGGVVRSLADRGPAGAPPHPLTVQNTPGPQSTGPEYLDTPRESAATVLPGPQLGEIPPQPGIPWDPQPPVTVPAPAASAPAPAEAVALPPEVLVTELVEALVPVAAEPEAVVAEPEPEPVAVEPEALAEPPVAVGTETEQPAPAEAAVPAPAEAVVPAPEAQTAEVAEPVIAEAEAVAVEPEAAEAVEPAAEAPSAEPEPEPVVAVEPQAAPEPAVVAQPAPEPVAEAAPEPEAPAEPVVVPAEAVAVPAAAPVAEQPPAPEPEAPAEPVVVPEVVVVPEPEAVAVPAAAPVAEQAPEQAPAAEPVAVVAEPQPEPAPVLVVEEEPEQEQAPAEAAPEPQPQPVPEPVVVAEEPAAPEPAAPEAVEPAAAEEPAAPEAVAPEPAAEEPEPEPEAAAEPAPVSVPVPEPVAEAPVEPNAPAPGYDDAEREAVLRVMRERRDIRNGFRADPIPHEVLLRVLEAAHTAPSVGHSQPWDFVVIRSAETRRTMHELATRQRDAYAKSLPKGRAKQFKELKIEAILDTPVNIVVTADPTRGGRHTLGRHSQPQMAPYSSALAVENLWLAARAEGLGVGWVSFFDEREMVRALGLPEHLEVVAYLCVGYVDEFPEEPELMQAGWSQRRPLAWVVHEETYGRRALPGEEPHDLLQETVAGIRPLDAKALGEAWERQKRMTKPAGALGMLEIISAQLSGLSRMCPPPIPEPAAVAIFAGDHGVHAQGVTAWPQEVTGQMVANFLGGGAVCNAFANQVGAEVCVIDVGVAVDLPATPGLLPRKVRAGTSDFTTGPALSREEVLQAIEVGIETARDLVAAGNKALLTGEMGIANTTVSAALISVFTGVDPGEITGRGTGINDEMHARKVDVVRRALELHKPDTTDPIGVLAAIGGLEHAALVGLILGGASLRTPVILDGVSAGAAALVARAIAPESLAACIAGHRGAEPGHVAALNTLGLRPLMDLDLRLGEGTGALLALPVVQSAARAMHEVATFDSAGVTEK